MKQIRNKYLTGIIIFLGLLFRLTELFSGKSLQFDEAVVWNVSNKNFSDIVSGDFFQYRFHPPLFYLFIKCWKTVSDSEIWLRLPSLIAGVFNIYLVFLIGRRLKNTKVGLISSFLLSVSSYHIFWSLQMRIYEIIFTFSLLYLLIFVQALVSKNIKWWIYLSLVGIIGFNIDYSFAWVYLVVNIYFFLNFLVMPVFTRRFNLNSPIKYWILSNIPITLTIIYYLSKIFTITLSSNNALDTWIPKTSFKLFFPQIISQVSNFINAKNFLIQQANNTYITNLFHLFSAIIIFLTLVSSVFFLTKRNKYFFLILLITYLPFVASFIISQYYPIFLSYNFIIASIGIILLLSILSSMNKSFMLAVMILWTLVNLFSLQTLIRQPSYEDWEKASAFLKQNIDSRYQVLFIPYYFNKSFFYHNQRYKILSNSSLNGACLSSDKEVIKKISDFQKEDTKHCLIERTYDFPRVQENISSIDFSYYKMTEKQSGIDIFCSKK